MRYVALLGGRKVPSYGTPRALKRSGHFESELASYPVLPVIMKNLSVMEEPPEGFLL